MRNGLKVIIGLLVLLVVGNFLYKKTSLYYMIMPRLPFSMHLNKENLVLESGETDRLRVYAINKRVSYHTSDFKVAYVNLNGKVFAKKTGIAYITAKVGKKTFRCKVRVIALSKKKLTMEEGESFQLRIYGDGLFHKARWSSDNTSIVSVSKNGKLVAKKKGRVNIIANIYGKKLVCRVKVIS
ncbi:Ig-like domain-containing protein [Anaerosporobacter faecicola]|uniref:Ig-like domain-containing protein n=1 Tax=Anaerosporobacter faecicola TaxID=2718714 RepID=UPI001438C34B|nr:Ig-like domain-containing protein [Anaerosporobacter faecicola]